MDSTKENIPGGSRPIDDHWWNDPRESAHRQYENSNPASWEGSLPHEPWSMTQDYDPYDLPIHDPKVPIPLPSAENYDKWLRDSCCSENEV